MVFNKEGADAYRVDGVTSGTLSKLVKNWVVLYSGTLLKIVWWSGGSQVLDIAWPNDTIEGVSIQARRYPTDNETVAKLKALYKPFVSDHTYKIKVITWQVISEDDIGKFVKIDADQFIDPSTVSISEWQFKIEWVFWWWTYAEVRILNEKDYTVLTDLYIVDIHVKVWWPAGMYEAELNNWSVFDVDLTALVPATPWGESQILVLWPWPTEISITESDGVTILDTIDIWSIIPSETVTNLVDGDNDGTPDENFATYTNESGTAQIVELVKSLWLSIDNTNPSDLKLKVTANWQPSNSLSLIPLIAQVDNYINAGSYDPVSMILTLQDVNPWTPDITINLADFYIDVISPTSYANQSAQLTATLANQITQDSTTKRVVIRDKWGNSLVLDYNNSSLITIVDAGNYYSSSNLEAVLQEVGADLDTLFSAVGSLAQADWSATSWPSQILNKAVKPSEMAGTITDWWIPLRVNANTRRNVVASDITAFWFQTKLSSWTVEWLDGIITWYYLYNNPWPISIDNSLWYRANYRWASTGNRWVNWTKGCWYDSITKRVVISLDDEIRFYNVLWDLISTVNLSGSTAWWYLQGSNLKRILLTKLDCKKIDLDTMLEVGTWITGTRLDISPSWEVFSAISGTTITFYDTDLMTAISTYTVSGTLGWLTFISDTEAVAHIKTPANVVNLVKITVATGVASQTVTSDIATNINSVAGWISYDPTTGLIYFGWFDDTASIWAKWRYYSKNPSNLTNTSTIWTTASVNEWQFITRQRDNSIISVDSSRDTTNMVSRFITNYWNKKRTEATEGQSPFWTPQQRHIQICPIHY